MYPREKREGLLSILALRMVQHIMAYHNKIFSKIILEYIYKFMEASRNTSLSFGNLLSKVFEHFKVSLEYEECIEMVDIVINKEKLETLKFNYTCFGQWLHKDEYTKKCTSAEPDKPTPKQCSPNSLLDTLSLEISMLAFTGDKFKTS